MTLSTIITAPKDEPEYIPPELLDALRRLPSKRWSQVLTFIEFLMYRETLESEDKISWDLVETEYAHRRKHPEEVVTCDSAEEFAMFLEGDE